MSSHHDHAREVSGVFERVGSGSSLPAINEKGGLMGETPPRSRSGSRPTSRQSIRPSSRQGQGPDGEFRPRSSLKSRSGEDGDGGSAHSRGPSRPMSRSSLRTPNLGGADGRPRTVEKRVAFPTDNLSISRNPSSDSVLFLDDSMGPHQQGGRGGSSRASTAASKSKLKKMFKFGVEDFVRAQDAKMGMDPIYNQSKPVMTLGTPSSSRPGTDGAPLSVKSRPNSRKAPSSRGSTAKSAGKASEDGKVEKKTETDYEKAKRENAERIAKEDARKKEQQDKIMAKKHEKKLAAVMLIQSYMRLRITCAGVHPMVEYWTGLTIFLNKQLCTTLMFRIYGTSIRSRYEGKPPITDNVLFFFPDTDNTTLEANWECQKARIYMEDNDIFLANEAVGKALQSLKSIGCCINVTKQQLAEDFFSTGGDIRKELALANPFCATPGCSRRPFKMCEWDEVSKICDQHVYTAVWDKEQKALSYGKRHQMNIGVPSRRDNFWASFLLGLHPRLGGDEGCYIGELLLPKNPTVQGNETSILERILNMAWTVTVPDEYPSIPQAVASVHDQTTIYVRRGLHQWREPIEVRRRIDVVGEDGCVVMGTWTLDDCSGGGVFENVTCVSYGSGRCVEARGGKWTFDRCLLRGGGDGVTVMSAVNDAQIIMKESVVCGMPSGLAGDTAHPWVGLHLGGNASAEIVGGWVRDAAGYGVDVCDSAEAVVRGLKLSDNSKAALRMEKASTVELLDNDFVDNGACIECQGHVLPHQVGRFDPLRLEMFLGGSKEQDCLKMVGNTIRGALFATSHRPTFLLGNCGDRYALDKGDILVENSFLPGSVCPPLRRKTGTGNEMYVTQLPDNSSLKCNDGSDFIEPYVRQRWEVAHVLTAPLNGWSKRAKALVFDIEELTEANTAGARERGYSADEWGVFTGSRAPTSLTQGYYSRTSMMQTGMTEQMESGFGGGSEWGDGGVAPGSHERDFWSYEEDEPPPRSGPPSRSGLASRSAAATPGGPALGVSISDLHHPSQPETPTIMRASGSFKAKRRPPGLEPQDPESQGQKQIRFQIETESNTPSSVGFWDASVFSREAGAEVLSTMTPVAGATPSHSILRTPSGAIKGGSTTTLRRVSSDEAGSIAGNRGHPQRRASFTEDVNGQDKVQSDEGEWSGSGRRRAGAAASGSMNAVLLSPLREESVDLRMSRDASMVYGDAQPPMTLSVMMGPEAKS